LKINEGLYNAKELTEHLNLPRRCIDRALNKMLYTVEIVTEIKIIKKNNFHRSCRFYKYKR